MTRSKKDKTNTPCFSFSPYNSAEFPMGQCMRHRVALSMRLTKPNDTQALSHLYIA